MIEILEIESNVNFVKFNIESKESEISFNYDKHYIYILSGVNTKGEKIKPQKILNEVEGKPNPTKVFKFIAKVLKKVLCPNCGINP